MIKTVMRLCDWRYGARTVSGNENVAPGYFKVDTPAHVGVPTVHGPPCIACQHTGWAPSRHQRYAYFAAQPLANSAARHSAGQAPTPCRPVVRLGHEPPAPLALPPPGVPLRFLLEIYLLYLKYYSLTALRICLSRLLEKGWCLAQDLCQAFLDELLQA